MLSQSLITRTLILYIYIENEVDGGKSAYRVGQQRAQIIGT